MEAHGPTFSQHSFAYKMPLHFNNLGIRGNFLCYKVPLRFQQLRIQGRALLLQNARVLFKNCTCKGTPLLHNATFQQDYPIQIVSLQNAQLFLKNPSSRHTLSLQNASVVFQIQDLDHIMLLQNVRLILISPSEAHQNFLQNATAILMKA